MALLGREGLATWAAFSSKVSSPCTHGTCPSCIPTHLHLHELAALKNRPASKQQTGLMLGGHEHCLWEGMVPGWKGMGTAVTGMGWLITIRLSAPLDRDVKRWPEGDGGVSEIRKVASSSVAAIMIAIKRARFMSMEDAEKMGWGWDAVETKRGKPVFEVEHLVRGFESMSIKDLNIDVKFCSLENECALRICYHTIHRSPSAEQRQRS